MGVGGGSLTLMKSYLIGVPIKRRKESIKSRPNPRIRPDTCQIINLRANYTKRWPRVGRVPGKDNVMWPHLI